MQIFRDAIRHIDTVADGPAPQKVAREIEVRERAQNAVNLRYPLGVSLPAKLVNKTVPSGVRSLNSDEFQNVQMVWRPSRRGTMKPNPSSRFATLDRS